MMKCLKKPNYLLAVCNGRAIPLREVPDEVFSSEMLGKGFAVEPADGIFYSPVSGKLQSIAESKHAYTILSEDGHDVLIHIGVDTVELNGKGFEPQASEGQKIRAGEILARADLELIQKNNFPTVTSVIITDSENIESIEYKLGAVSGGKDAVMSYRNCKKG